MNTKDRNEILALLRAAQESACRARRAFKRGDLKLASERADDAQNWAKEARDLLLTAHVSETGNAPWYEEKAEMYRLTHGGAA